MIDVNTFGAEHQPHTTLMWHNVEISPRWVRLFRAWAQKRGQSDADLASDIFAAGTLALVCDHLQIDPPAYDGAPDRAALDAALGYLAVALGVPVEE